MADLRTEKTLALIDETIFGLLNDVSFERLTVAQICTTAKIGRSTFYQHYLDKYDWLEQKNDYYGEIFQEGLSKRFGNRKGNRSLVGLFDYLQAYKNQVLQLTAIHLTNNDLAENMKHMLSVSISKEIPDEKQTGIPMEYLANLYATIAMNNILWTLENGVNENIGMLMNQISDAVINTVKFSSKQ